MKMSKREESLKDDAIFLCLVSGCVVSACQEETIHIKSFCYDKQEKIEGDDNLPD